MYSQNRRIFHSFQGRVKNINSKKEGGGGGYKNFNGNKGPWNKKVYGIARVVDTRIGLFISDLCWFVFLTGNPQL